MNAIYDANNPDNWINLYSNSFEATYTQGKQISIYTPIPKTALNLEIDSPILAIYAESTQYPNSQKYLGKIYQSILGNNIFPSPTLTHQGVSIYANQTVFAEFTQFDDNYDLILDVQWKVENISITIFKYVGEIKNPVNTQIQELEDKIVQLELKLDEYFSQPPTGTGETQAQNYTATNFTNLL